jgi:hypothetical protein
VIISLYNIFWRVCITETECVYCAVRTGFLWIIEVHISIWRVNVTFWSNWWSVKQRMMVINEIGGLWVQAAQATGNVLVLACKNRGKPRKFSVKIIVVPTEIWTQT